MRHLSLLLVLPLALTACDGKGGTSVSINATSDDGDGFEGNFKLPAIKMTAENFDMDGVKLYPNSTITSFNIDAKDHPGEGKDEGKVVAAFTSPAALSTVQSWFHDKLTTKGVKFSEKGNGFAGTTEDGERFTLDLSAAGGEKTNGKMEIVGS